MSFDENLRAIIDQIWDNYDTDASGKLDKEESRKFVREALVEFGGSADECTEEAFEECFAQFDRDGSGFIEKDEMINVIKEINGAN